MATPWSDDGKTQIRETHAKGLNGDIARQFPYKIERYRAEAAIAFGKAVEKGATDDSVKVGITAAGGKVTRFLGIAVADRTLSGFQGATPGTVPPNRPVQVIFEGDIYVTVSTAVAVGDKLRIASNGNLETGNGDGANSGTAPGRWMSAAAVGEVARLRLYGLQDQSF